MNNPPPFLAHLPVMKCFLTPDIEPVYYCPLQRSCHICCDPGECMDVVAPDFDEDLSLPACPRRP